MAKYIDVDEVLKHIARFRKILEHNIYVSCTEVSKVEVIEDCIKQQPPANVIEREKVDKAIEEIKDKSYLTYDDNPRRVLDEECVLEILKRNIGL